jgi:hypothetical protein
MDRSANKSESRIPACHAKYLGVEITVAITLALRYCPESTQRHCGQVEISEGQSLSLQAIAGRQNKFNIKKSNHQNVFLFSDALIRKLA